MTEAQQTEIVKSFISEPTFYRDMTGTACVRYWNALTGEHVAYLPDLATSILRHQRSFAKA